MPKPDQVDGERAAAKWQPDWCKASLQDVTAVLDKLSVPPSRTRIIGGSFVDTLNMVITGPIAILHLDADWYGSTKLCLERFLPEMMPGGLVIVDDYHHWPGCKKAVDELGRELHEMDGTAVWFQV